MCPSLRNLGCSEPRYVELWAIVEAWGEHPFPRNPVR
jgi:hypothetical protein